MPVRCAVGTVNVAPTIAAATFVVMPAKRVSTTLVAAQVPRCAAMSAVSQAKPASVARAVQVLSNAALSAVRRAKPASMARAAPAFRPAAVSAAIQANVKLVLAAPALAPAILANVKPA